MELWDQSDDIIMTEGGEGVEASFIWKYFTLYFKTIFLLINEYLVGQQRNKLRVKLR